jgi:hypothetical protein
MQESKDSELEIAEEADPNRLKEDSSGQIPPRLVQRDASIPNSNEHFVVEDPDEHKQYPVQDLERYTQYLGK